MKFSFVFVNIFRVFRMRQELKFVLIWWRYLVLLVTPIVLLPLPIFLNSSESRCAYMMILMAIYWVTEALPLGVTALIPVVLAPALGIMQSKIICPYYFKSVNMLFIGGLIMAVCIEKWKLHKRIALRVLLLVGTSARWLMLGFMLPTWFLSMWISNTATTAMMSPMAYAVLEQMQKTKLQLATKRKPCSSIKETDIDVCDDDKNPTERAKNESDEPPSDFDQVDMNDIKDPEMERLYKSMLLSIAYAANTGGIATLTGTGPNLVLKGQLDQLFDGDSGITFASWMAFCLPISVLMFTFCWLWLQVLFMGFKRTFTGFCDPRHSDPAVHGIVQREYDELGSMTWPQIASLAMFTFLAILWFTRSPEFYTGWGDMFPEGYVDDATAAIFVAVLLFCVPAFLPCTKGKGSSPPQPLLDWETVSLRLPWDIVLLLGGGFALAAASQKSGLSELIGRRLSGLGALPPWFIVLVICALIATLTEITSNTATATLMMPILSDLAIFVNVHPIYLMFPAAVSASFAFMLPVATPPNAIVFSSGHLRIKDMAKAGFLMNLAAIICVTLAVNTWGYQYFDLGTLPPWMLKNVTEVSSTVTTSTTI
ncbi:Na(+)/citrate cotransporter-like [Tubulanus polymorphus]|uniref:Na(+)/citrate cotransporter-like n=1 Tax=Tubulanus polymorphus TaxID=672921 RepID=UPI003DA5C3D2